MSSVIFMTFSNCSGSRLSPLSLFSLSSLACRSFFFRFRACFSFSTSGSSWIFGAGADGEASGRQSSFDGSFVSALVTPESFSWPPPPSPSSSAAFAFFRASRLLAFLLVAFASPLRLSVSSTAAPGTPPEPRVLNASAVRFL